MIASVGLLQLQAYPFSKTLQRENYQLQDGGAVAKNTYGLVVNRRFCGSELEQGID